MKLLQHSWSDLLVLDHMHQRMHNGLPDETTLPNGQKFDLLSLALLGVPAVADSLQQVQNRFAELKLDPLEYLAVKFLLLLNPGNELRVVTATATMSSLMSFCLQLSFLHSIASRPALSFRRIALYNLFNVCNRLSFHCVVEYFACP